jgi:hypothetical protein
LNAENGLITSVIATSGAIHDGKLFCTLKDGHIQVWEQLTATPQYQEGLKERNKIERKFG